MAVFWRFGLILLGFAAATLIAAATGVREAAAEAAESPSASRSRAAPQRDAAGSGYETPARRPSRAGRSLYDDPDAELAPAGERADADAPEASDSDPLSDASGDAGDGEPAAPPDGVLAEDGVIDITESQYPEDGADPLRDTRPPEDAGVFANPPAGHDPLLFQIEDIDPVATDRRPQRLARFEPYDPVGIRIGSFVLFPEIKIGGAATSNVLNAPAARSDFVADIRTSSRLVSNWSAHALELRGTTFTTFHDDFPSEDDRAWTAEARGRVDIARRTNLQAIAGHDVSQESRTAIDASTVGERAEVTVDRAELAFNHRFNRLSVQLRGSVSDAEYSDTDGMSNADRDTFETGQAVRATLEFKPTLAVFAEQELNQRDKGALPTDGIGRDSKGSRTRVGLDFGSQGAILRGTIGIGYGVQDPDNSSLSAVEAVLFDANLAWRPSEITSFLLSAQSDIYDTTTELSGGVVAHRVGLEARHALRRYLIATAGLTYTHYDYDATPLRESELVAYLGADYYASPHLVLFARYQHLDFDSNEANGDYDGDEVRAGVRLRP